MRNYVIINGVNSLDIKGLAISKLPSISKPPLRVMTEEIDGRDGDIITELGYGAYDKELVIGLYENYDINEIIGFFNQEGTIVFSNEDDKYYNFKIINQIDYEALIKFRTANVTLHCQPFKYPLEEEPIELIDTYVEEEGEEITLTPTEEAPMEITLKGNTSQVIIPGETGTEVEGTSITLTDVIPTKENYIIPKGNTSQVQYTGKNLWNMLESLYGTSVSTNDDKVYTFETTTNTRTYTINGETNTAYTIDFTLSADKGDVAYYFVYSDTTKEYINEKSTASSFTQHVNKTSNSEKTLIGIEIKTYSVANYKTYTFTEPMLVKGTTLGEYEPYCGGTPSPNPDYPQDIHSVSGDNEIEVCGKNLEQGMEQGGINESGVLYPSNTTIRSKYFNLVEPNTQYIISMNGSLVNISVLEYDKDKNLLSFTARNNAFTTSANTKYIKVVKVTSLDSKIQIEKGNQISQYEPYTGNTYPLYLGVENLQNGTTDFSNYVNYLVTNAKDDESITITSTANNTYAGTTFDKTIPKAGTYTLQMKATFDTNGLPSFRIGSSLYATKVLNTNYYLLYATFTTTSDNETINVSLYPSMTTNTSTHTAKFYDFQIEKGTKANHYTPYGTTPITLNKIGNYQDKIVKTDKWYWYREIGKVVLDGTENWQSASSVVSGTSRFYYDNNEILNPVLTNTPLSNMFKSLKWIEIYSQDTTTRYGVAVWDDASHQGRLIIRIDNTLASSVATFKTWLGTNQPIVYYVLATPTYTEITDATLLQQLDDLYNATIYGTTNISSIPNDLEPFIDIKYNVITPSPSPQRPSAINVVSGTNTIKIANEDDTESQTFNIRLGSLKLYKLNDTQDYIYKSGDKWYIRNHAKEKTFTGVGSEGWGCFQNGRGEWCILTTNIRNEVKQGSSLIADILPFFSSATFNGLFNQNAITLGGKNIELMIEGINENDDELFTDFLAIHNLTILYELATPIDTEITDADLIEDLEALLEATSYNPETNITQTSNDKPFIIYAKALEGGSGEAEVINVGNIYAKPIIEIEGTGEVQVLIDNNEVLQVDTTNDTIIIDTENMEAINKSDNTLANRQVIGDYSKIKLVPGENDIKLTGNYTKGTITKYTRYL